MKDHFPNWPHFGKMRKVIGAILDHMELHNLSEMLPDSRKVSDCVSRPGESLSQAGLQSDHAHL